MRELAQQAVLSAYIASIGKRTPREAAHDAAELYSLARALRRLNEVSCNYGLTPRQEKRMRGLEDSIRTVLGQTGLALNHSDNDPRGYSLYVNLPDGSYNSFGGREHGYGIG
jgi:hypothetical protein